jgi:hypothetical protein
MPTTNRECELIATRDIDLDCSSLPGVDSKTTDDFHLHLATCVVSDEIAAGRATQEDRAREMMCR